MKVLGNAFLRNIDPSFILKQTHSEDWRIKSNPWWVADTYDSWNEGTKIEWVKSRNKIPNGQKLLKVTDTNATKWLVLEGFYRWVEPTPSDKDQSKIPIKELYFFIRSYFIHKKDKKKIFEWAKRQNWYGRWMPESNYQTRIFHGEFYNSKAYYFHNIPYFYHSGWTKPRKNVNYSFYVTADQYLQETGYDCSIDSSVRIYLPSELIVKEMDLEWNGNESHYYNSNGELVVFDPSTKEYGPSCLLINNKLFTKFLKNSDYEILWTIAGEKYIIVPTYGSKHINYGRLQINGAYCLYSENLKGQMNFQYKHPPKIHT